MSQVVKISPEVFLTSTPQTPKGSLNNLHTVTQVCLCGFGYVCCSLRDDCHSSEGSAVLFIMPSDPEPDVQNDSCFLLAKLTLLPSLSLYDILTHTHTHTHIRIV